MRNTSGFSQDKHSDTCFEVMKVYVQITPCVLVHSVQIAAECSPPDGELQYPVRALDEDEGFLSAAVEGGSVDVDELVADFQLLAQGGLPSVLNLWGGKGKDTSWWRCKRKTTGRQTEKHSD